MTHLQPASLGSSAAPLESLGFEAGLAGADVAFAAGAAAGAAGAGAAGAAGAVEALPGAVQSGRGSPLIFLNASRIMVSVSS